MQEVLSNQNERTFFCVGDVKQGIYNWRGGRAGLLSDLPTKWSSLRLLTLNESWRSSAIILEYCNKVFRSLDRVGFEGHLLRAAQKWEKEYPTHSTRIEAPGYIECELVADDQEAESFDVNMGVEKANELFRVNPNISIAILVRTNDKALACANKMYERFPDILFSIDGNIPFISDSTIRGVLSALMIIDTPHSIFDRFYLATSELGSCLSYGDWQKDEEAEKLSRFLSEKLALQGLEGVVRYLVTFALRLSKESTKEFCYRILGVVSDYRESSIEEFVGIIKKMSIPNQGRSRLSIMTIHKAKGLEFDAVILVDLNQAMISQVQTRSFLTHCDSPFSGYTEIVSMPKKALTEYDAHLLQLWQEAEEEQLFEALSILYVAITRARFGLYIYLPEKRRKMSFATVLETVSAEGYRDGDRAWYEKI